MLRKTIFVWMISIVTAQLNPGKLNILNNCSVEYFIIFLGSTSIFSSRWNVSDNMVIVTMMIGSFMVVTLCLLLAIVIHCFNRKELKGFHKFKRRCRIQRSYQATALNFIKEETSTFTNRDEIEWDHIDVPIDARMQSTYKYRKASNNIFDKPIEIQKHFTNPDYNLYNSYHSVLSTN